VKELNNNLTQFIEHSHCDSMIFKQIDCLPYQNTFEVNFLHSLRTFSYYLSSWNNQYQKMLDQIASDFEQIDVQLNLLDEPVNEIEELINKIPNDLFLEREIVTELLNEFEKLNTSVKKEHRDEASKMANKNFESLLNKDIYPITGKFFKSEIKKIFLMLDNAKQELEKNTSINLMKEHLILEIEKIKSKTNNLTSSLRQNKYEIFNYQHRSIDGLFLIAGAFVFKLIDGVDIALTFFPEKETNKTHFLFSELNNTTERTIFLNRLNIMPDTEFLNVVSGFILYSGTNVYLSPEYWVKIPDEIKEKFVDNKKELLNSNFNLFSKELQSHLKSIW
jgi:hypothetical protein